jgi:hypothetical protein
MVMSSEKIRLYIGSSSNGEDALIEAAYEYSLRKETDRELEIVWMRQTNDESSYWHGFADQNWSTPFSGFRWAIPEHCNFEGRAIYTDVDMLNFHDIGELFDMDMGDHYMLARDGKRFGGKEFCVILFDCSKFKGFIAPTEQWKVHATAHHQFIQYFVKTPNLVGSLHPEWNSHDGDTFPFKQLHYTHMPTQPWKPSWFTGLAEEHPKAEHVELFWAYVHMAKENGYDPADYAGEGNVKYNIIGN